MRIGLIAIAGVKIQTQKFVELGITLPQFVNRSQVIAQLPSLALLTLSGATISRSVSAPQALVTSGQTISPTDVLRSAKA